MSIINSETMPHYMHGLITSISGWRKIFIPVKTNYKSCLRIQKLENASYICDEDFLLVYYAVTSYLDSMFNVWRNVDTSYTLAFGRDTRFTGESILEASLQASRQHSCSSNLQCVNMDIISSPQIMSYTRIHADGFIYITASHNPPEYNGIKFGAGDGGVLQRDLAHNVINRFFSFYIKKISKVLEYPDENFDYISNAKATSEGKFVEKKRAYQAYSKTVLKAVFRGLKNSVKDIVTTVQEYVNAYERPLGIIWDANGGSRATSVDVDFFNNLKIRVKRINTNLGFFAHQIIPEGDALNAARQELIACNDTSKNAGESSWYPLALVLDCDGDRGNIVFYDSTMPQLTRVMKAQEVFVFVLRIELAWQRFVTPNAKLAVVVNGPSTVRCEIVAKYYNCKIFRVEVGETNLVAKAEQLRGEGYIVPIVGEASNGGIIIYPSAVRDPLCTALSCIKLLLWHDTLANAGLIERAYADIFTTFAKNIPAASTTEVEDPYAKFDIPAHVSVEKTLQHIVRYIKHNIHILTEVFENAGVFVQCICCYNFIGTVAYEYSLEQIEPDTIRKGGVGFYFYKTKHKTIPHGFVWIRPSGTEPCIRLVADVIGKNASQIERKLIYVWQTLLHDAVLTIPV